MVVPSIVVYARNNFGAPETGLVETGPTVLVATALEQPIATYSSVITRMETTHGPTSSWLQQCNHIGNMKRWQLHFVDDRPFCSLAWKMKTNFTVLHLYITCWHIIVNATLSISMCTLTLHLKHVDTGLRCELSAHGCNGCCWIDCMHMQQPAVIDFSMYSSSATHASQLQSASLCACAKFAQAYTWK